MKFDVVIKHPSGNLIIPRLSSINGISGIEALTEYPVYLNSGRQVNEQPSYDHDTLVYEVDIGDYIFKQEYKDGTTYVSYYKIVDITDTEVIAEPTQ